MMPQPVSLTFPPGFDPLALTDAEVAAVVRDQWVRQANEELREAFAAARDAEPADTVPPDGEWELPTLEEIDSPTIKLTAAEAVEMREAGVRAALAESAKMRAVAENWPSNDALWPPPDNG